MEKKIISQLRTCKSVMGLTNQIQNIIIQFKGEANVLNLQQPNRPRKAKTKNLPQELLPIDPTMVRYAVHEKCFIIKNMYDELELQPLPIDQMPKILLSPTQKQHLLQQLQPKKVEIEFFGTENYSDDEDPTSTSTSKSQSTSKTQEIVNSNEAFLKADAEQTNQREQLYALTRTQSPDEKRFKRYTIQKCDLIKCPKEILSVIMVLENGEEWFLVQPELYLAPDNAKAYSMRPKEAKESTFKIQASKIPYFVIFGDIKIV